MDCKENTKKRKRSASPVAAGNISSASASASASASSSASASKGNNNYEVFLSFKGKETRAGFADFLYEDLVCRGIRTFRDNEEILIGGGIGPEVLKAINESKIFIPILSSNYACSKWCLLELAQSVECQSTTGQNIFPIFYNVDPSDVRRQTGSFEEAFVQHSNQQSNQYDEETVKKWKEALTKVGELKGWDLEKTANGHEGRLVKIIVQEVWLRLKKNYMPVTEDLVGIDHHVEVLMGLLDVKSNGARIVGIHGMAGIGKTTIAKFIYNQLYERFECCCFLRNVQKASQKLGLVNLQNKLIYDIVQGNYNEFANLDKGKEMIRYVVGRKRVLIVLDNVDEEYQFDKLVGKLDWFSSGSRIIVTTRNKYVLIKLEVNRTYELPLMEPHHSLQLFCKHAFRKDFPPKGYGIISREIVSTAGGLPLALKNIGRSLFKEDIPEWNDTLSKWKEMLDEKVRKKLIISYEALKEKEKQIFLDVACLFIGVEKGIAFYMWDACKFYPRSGIKVLEFKSLLTIGDNNELGMHVQLQILGREIVLNENIKDPGERSRLWIHEEALDILEKQKGTKNVEALCLDLELESCGGPFTNEAFGQLPNLKFLKVGSRDLAGDFNNLLSNLKWLHWHKWQANLRPENFHPENLVILELPHSCITHEWELLSQIKMAKRLKVLDLSYCGGVTSIPKFCTFSTLERLILKGCRNMFQIDQSIENLKNLRVLDIAGSGITNLPDVIGNLKMLEEIKASGSLLGAIPCNIRRLSSLRILRLDSTKIRSLPESIRELPLLEILDLMTCEELEFVPELPFSLTSLSVTCETFSILSNLMRLSDLAFSECLNVVEILGYIGKLSNLKTLTLCKSNICTLPKEIGDLSQLKQFKVQICKNLQCVPPLPSSLFKLFLEDCESMERLADLSNLKNLSELKLVKCSQLMEIPGLGNLESLRSLDVSSCVKLADLDGLEGLKSLRCLITSGCESLERLPVLSNLRILKELTLCKCEKLVEVGGLEVLNSLERLDVSYCSSLERSVLDLSNLKNLTELKICGWNDLTKIHGLEELKDLVPFWDSFRVESEVESKAESEVESESGGRQFE